MNLISVLYYFSGLWATSILWASVSPLKREGAYIDIWKVFVRISQFETLSLVLTRSRHPINCRCEVCGSYSILYSPLSEMKYLFLYYVIFVLNTQRCKHLSFIVHLKRQKSVYINRCFVNTFYTKYCYFSLEDLLFHVNIWY